MPEIEGCLSSECLAQLLEKIPLVMALFLIATPVILAIFFLIYFFDSKIKQKKEKEIGCIECFTTSCVYVRKEGHACCVCRNLAVIEACCRCGDEIEQ